MGRLGNRFSYINEDRDLGLNIHRFGPDEVLAVDCGLDKQFVSSKRNAGKFKLPRGCGIFDEFGCALAHFAPHVRGDISERFNLSRTIVFREMFPILREIWFEELPVVVQSRLNLFVPHFGVLRRQQSDVSGLRDLASFWRFYKTDNPSVVRSLKQS